MSIYYLNTPLDEKSISKLNAGDMVYLTGKIYSARDMAHLRIKLIYDENKTFGEDLKGYAVFHAGPIVRIDEGKGTYEITAIGPTSSIRMESYSDLVGSLGIKAIIGKGGMGELTTAAMKKHNMVYLLAAHGCSAVHTKKITGIKRQYWMEEVGMPEALWVMECKELGPLIVGIDSKGRNLFEETKKHSREMIEEMTGQSALKSV